VARIFFPFAGEDIVVDGLPDNEHITWTDMARRNGRMAHALMEAETIQATEDVRAISYDELVPGQFEVLLPILTRHTSSSRGWFLLWEGFGTGVAGSAYNRQVAAVAVALNLEYDQARRELVLVKLSTPTWEFNFRATAADLAGLSSIGDADWQAGRSLHIGESAGAPVHWAAKEETATIMVGHDDQTWDIALIVPIATVDTIVADAADGSWRLGHFEPG